MVRRVVEEDITDSPTVVERDDSWIGRMLVTLVVIALLVVGAIWLVNAMGDSDNDTNVPNINNEQQQNNPDNNTDTDPGTGTDNTNPDSGTGG